MTDPSTHLFWITSRAAGTAALVLSSASVGLGLSMGGRLVRRWATERRTLHETLSLATMVALLVHGLALLGDGFLKPTLGDIAIPFAFSYKEAWNTIGIVGGWGIILLGLSFYARDRIGRARWLVIHRFTLLAWALGLVHSLGEGTDAGQGWFLALTGLTAAPVLVALAARVTSSRASTRATTRADAPARAARTPA